MTPAKRCGYQLLSKGVLYRKINNKPLTRATYKQQKLQQQYNDVCLRDFDTFRLPLQDGVYANISNQYTGIAVYYNESLEACVVLQLFGTKVAFLSTHISDSKNLKSLIAKCGVKVGDKTWDKLFWKYDHIVCFGSLNSKLSLTSKQTINKMSAGNMMQLWKHDAMRRVLISEEYQSQFEKFKEPIPRLDFHATYPKQIYDTKETNLDAQTNISFCDRLLYYSSPLVRDKSALLPENNLQFLIHITIYITIIMRYKLLI